MFRALHQDTVVNLVSDTVGGHAKEEGEFELSVGCVRRQWMVKLKLLKVAELKLLPSVLSHRSA